MKCLKTIVTAVATVAWLTGAAWAQEGEPRPERGMGLAKADANGDGEVTFEELSAVRPDLTRERFSSLDRNGDGVLSKADREAGPREGGKGGRGEAPERGAMLKKLLEADVDKDGQVTFEEVTAKRPGFPRESFDRADRNKDGVLSEADIKAEVGKAPDWSGKAPAQSGQRAAMRGEVMQRLREADKDGDGRVTFEEAQASMPRLTEDMFKRMDRNGDGVISPEDRAPQRQN